MALLTSMCPFLFSILAPQVLPALVVFQCLQGAILLFISFSMIPEMYNCS